MLTTHSMEEAEALSTKIAIQVDGILKCIGSVQHIKSKFGQGYEVEIKVRLPTEQYYKDKLVELSLQPQSRLTMMSQISDILTQVKMHYLYKDIKNEGYGSSIYNEVFSPNGLVIENLLEFIHIEAVGQNLQAFIKSNLGDYSIIEHLDSVYR